MSARSDDGMTLEEARGIVERSRHYHSLTDHEVTALRMVHADLEATVRELRTLMARSAR